MKRTITLIAITIAFGLGACCSTGSCPMKKKKADACCAKGKSACCAR